MISNGEGCPGKSRHMRVRWHFISELLDIKFIEDEHVQTNLMIADLLTKPMGGQKFRELRGQLMNFQIDEDEVNEEDGSDGEVEGSDEEIN